MSRTRSTSNDRNNRVAKLLTRVEKRLRRVGAKRGTTELKRSYRTAADLVHEAITPKR